MSEVFTPASALAGGILIGISASLLLLLNGRIAGISGILGGLFQAPASDRAWRAAFLGGLLIGVIRTSRSAKSPLPRTVITVASPRP